MRIGKEKFWEKEEKVEEVKREERKGIFVL